MTFAPTHLLLYFLASAVALLPFGRLVELPLGLLSLLGAMMLLGLPRDERLPWRLLLLIWLSYTIPMLLALPDAVESGKSLRTSLGGVRYGLFCVAMISLYAMAQDRQRMQQVTLSGFGLAVALLLSLWSLDAIWQFYSGRNLLGYGVGEGYVNGVFGEDDNIKLGASLALFMPVAFVRSLRSGPTPVAALVLLLILAAIALSGKRAAWICAVVELSLLALYFALRGHLGLRRGLVAGIAVAAVASAAFIYSDWVRERSSVIVTAVENPDYETLNRATGIRLPIWATAWRMGRDHWINGVGPRGFRYAYPDYAAADDPWAQPLPDAKGAKASHAHQLLLDLFSETGVIGVGGYVLMLLLLGRAWLSAGPAARSRALPYAAALAGTLFPVNTHSAWYSSWSSSLLWLFIGLYLFALCETREEREAEGDAVRDEAGDATA
ncbi:MAG: O-antigen ligase family protein [Pseudomonadota bacterium]